MIMLDNSHQLQKKLMELNLPYQTRSQLVSKFLQYKKKGFIDFTSDLNLYITSKGAQKLGKAIHAIFTKAKEKYKKYFAQLIVSDLKIIYFKVLDWIYYRAQILFKQQNGLLRLKTAEIYQQTCRIHWQLLSNSSTNSMIRLKQLCESVGLQVKDSFFKHPISNFQEINYTSYLLADQQILSEVYRELKYQIEMLKIQILSATLHESKFNKVAEKQQPYEQNKYRKIEENSMARCSRMRQVSKSLYKHFILWRQISRDNKQRAYKFIIYLSYLARSAQMYLKCLLVHYPQISNVVYIDVSPIIETYRIYFFIRKTPSTPFSTEQLLTIQIQGQNQKIIQQYSPDNATTIKMKIFFFQNKLSSNSEQNMKLFIKQTLGETKQKLTKVKQRTYESRKKINEQIKPILNQLRSNFKKSSQKYPYKELVANQYNKSLIESASFIFLPLDQVRQLLVNSNKFSTYLSIMRQRRMITKTQQQKQSLLTQVQIVLPNVGQLEQLSKSIHFPSYLQSPIYSKQYLCKFLEQRIRINSDYSYQTRLQNVIYLADQAMKLQIILRNLQMQPQEALFQQNVTRRYLKQINNVLTQPIDLDAFLKQPAKYCQYLSHFQLSFKNTLKIFFFIVAFNDGVNTQFQVDPNTQVGILKGSLMRFIPLIKENEGMIQAFLICLVILDNKNRTNQPLISAITEVVRQLKQLTTKDFYQRFLAFFHSQIDMFSRARLQSAADKFVDVQKNQLYSSQSKRPSNVNIIEKHSFLNQIDNIYDLFTQTQQFNYSQVVKSIKQLEFQNQSQEIKFQKSRIEQIQKEIEGIQANLSSLKQQKQKLRYRIKSIRQMIKNFEMRGGNKWIYDDMLIPQAKGPFNANFQSLRQHLKRSQTQLANAQALQLMFTKAVRYFTAQINQQQIRNLREFLVIRKVQIDAALKKSQGLRKIFSVLSQTLSNQQQRYNIIHESNLSSVMTLQQSMRQCNLKIYNLNQKLRESFEELRNVERSLKMQQRNQKGKQNRLQALEKTMQTDMEKRQNQRKRVQEQALELARQQAHKNEIYDNITVLENIVEKYNFFYHSLLDQIAKINDQIIQVAQQKVSAKLLKFLVKLQQIINQIYDIGNIISEVHVNVFTPKFSSLIIEYKRLIV